MDTPSTEWIEELGASLRAVDGDDHDPLVLQYEVGASVHHVIIGAANDAVAGAHPTPDVVFTADEKTAGAIARGELNAQAAFMSGDLRVRGDVTSLIDRIDGMARFDGATVAVRTRFPPMWA